MPFVSLHAPRCYIDVAMKERAPSCSPCHVRFWSMLSFKPSIPCSPRESLWCPQKLNFILLDVTFITECINDESSHWFIMPAGNCAESRRRMGFRCVIPSPNLYPLIKATNFYLPFHIRSLSLSQLSHHLCVMYVWCQHLIFHVENENERDEIMWKGNREKRESWY